MNNIISEYDTILKEIGAWIQLPGEEGGWDLSKVEAFFAGLNYKQKCDETMIERACKAYCDNLCERGMAGMCFHKHDGQGQIKNNFKYNECNDLKVLIRNMKY